MGCRKSPYLIALTVTVHLIIPFTRHTAIDTDAKMIAFREVMIPCRIPVCLVMRHTVNGDFFHDFIFRVILMRLGVQITV